MPIYKLNQPATESPGLPEQLVSAEVRAEKYAQGKEKTPSDIRWRVALALAQLEKPELRDMFTRAFFDAQESGFITAGRINSAAGTSFVATMMNCGVIEIGDRMSGVVDGVPGIMDALLMSGESLRRAMGVGYDFSPIRPLGALVSGTGSMAGGPLCFMDIFDTMCKSVQAFGSRRGAQMGVLRIDHPDILDFIKAKSEEGRLTQFNLSVAVTDEFLEALKTGRRFELTHEAPPHRMFLETINGTTVVTPPLRNVEPRADGRYVYETVDPQELWDSIMSQTYDHAEPGILFVDQANRENNLWYCEKLSATNPCAEQYLPPFGVCDLGSVNLSLFVRDSFTDEASFDFDGLAKVIPSAVRMLDNVLDATRWPLPQQKAESDSKRRIGLGFTALGNALSMLGIRYNTDEGFAFGEKVARFIMEEAYMASVELAKEKGPLPLFDAEKYLQSGFAKRLPPHIRDAIREHGIRNSHLLSVAPTGTISLTFANNASNGIEPPFSWYYNRKKRKADGEHQDYFVFDYAFRLYHYQKTGVDAVECDAKTLKKMARDLPDYFVSALEMSASDHMRMVAAVQPFVDSSISKTVNIPEDYPFGDFKDLYTEASAAGLKGLATFRPNPITGSILSTEPTENGAMTVSVNDADRRLSIENVPEPVMESLRWPKRPTLKGGNPAWTYMVKTDEYNFAVFIGHTINGTNHPFEVWVNGAEQPRGLGAIAKALSMDMRSEDRMFLKAKLDSLERAAGDDGFDLDHPSLHIA